MRNIAIEIGKDRLWLASGASLGGKAQLEHLAFRDLSEEHSVGTELAELVKACGLKGGRCTAVVRRGDIELRTTELPTTTLSELPDMVRFATSRLFASASDSWPIDFVVLPAAGPEATRETTSVLAAAIPPPLVAKLRAACQAAGLELHSISLAPVEVATGLCSLPAATAGSDSVLIVEPLATSTELTSCSGGRVTSIRSVRSPLSGDADSLRDLAGEIRRTSLAAAGAGSPPRLLLLGGTVEAAASLGQAAGVSVERIPLGELAAGHHLKPAEAEVLSVAGAGGVVAAIAAGPHPSGKAGPPIEGSRIDFLDPRRYVEPPRSRFKLIGAASGIAALLLIGLLAYWLQSRSLDSQIASLQEELAAGKQTVENSKRLVANQETIRGFVDRRANWLDELAYLSTKSLPGEQMIVGDITASVAAVGETGSYTTTVLVSEGDLGTAFERKMRDAEHVVSTKGWNPTIDDSAFYYWVGDVTVTVPLKDESAWLPPVATEGPTDSAPPPAGDLAQSSEVRE